MAAWLERFKALILQGPIPVTRIGQLFFSFLKILYHVFEKAWEDHFTRRAAALSFFTLINLFPIAGLALFALSHSPIFKEHMAAVESALVEQLVTPAARQVVLDFFESLSKNLFVLGKGISGFLTVLVLLFLGSTLLLLVERSLNEVWRAPKRRGGVLSRLTLLWAGLTLVPLLVGFSFALSTSFKKELAQFHAVSHYVLPYLITLAAFLMLYRFVPKVRFRMGPVFISAFLAALFWEAAKLGLSSYVEIIFSQSPVKKLYGSLALVPIVMVWIYYSWLIVLLGAELLYVLHNLDKIHVEARRRWLIGRGFAPLSRQAALTLLLDVYRSFEVGKGPAPGLDLPSRYLIHPDQADQWFSALEGAGILSRTPDSGLLPARPASAVPLRKVAALYHETFERLLSTEAGPQAGWARDEAEAFLGTWGDRSLAEMIPGPGAPVTP